MNDSTSINIRINKEIKDNVEKILESLGLNVTTAINMFFRQIIRVNGIPFEIKNDIPNKETLEAILESIKLANDDSRGCNSIEELRKMLDV